MSLLIALILGLVQGLTEFLPVSSTAHLTLAENLLLGSSMPLAFDVLLHVGTLLALVVYFRRDLAAMLRGLAGRDPEGLRLAGWLLVAMVPTVVLGFATRPLKAAAKDHIWVYGVCLFLTAGLLWAANALAGRRVGREVSQVGAWDALAVGAIQGLGGGFGLSRSGSTIAAGVFRGLALPAAARFSFLLGMPTIFGAAVLEGRHLVKALLDPAHAGQVFPAGGAAPALVCLVGVAAAAISGYLAIGLLDRFTRRPRLSLFAAYCAFAGTVLLIMAAGTR